MELFRELYWDAYCEPFFENRNLPSLDDFIFDEARISEIEEKADAYYRSLEP